MDGPCTLKEASARMYGEISNDIDPLTPPGKDSSNWGEYLHEQEGGVLSIAGRLTKAAGIEAPYRIKGLMKVHNPLMEFIKGGENPNVLQRGIFDFLKPSEAVAKPILNEYIKARSDYLEYIKEAPEVGKDVYREEVSARASDLLKKIENDPTKYGVDSSNVHMTTRFLKQVENGWPYADYAANAVKTTEDLEPGVTQLFKNGASNVMKSHVMLNQMIYLFHLGTTPVRVFSLYPAAATKILPELLSKPGIFLGETIPEALKANVYTKPLDTIDVRKWSKNDWQKGLTGIPQTQTFNESIAYLLSKHGVPLDQALERVALSTRDPLEMPMFMTAPDRGGSISSLTYMRYAMFQHAAYLNMVKRMTDLKNPEEAAKAAGSFLLYTGLNYALFGKKAAIPASGLVDKVVNLGGDGSQEEEDGGGNLVYNTTGLDLGEAMSPLSFFDFYHSIKMVENVQKGVTSDLAALKKDSTNTAKSFAAAHMILLGSELFSHQGFTTPHSLTKAVKSYGKALDDASDNPLDENWNEFYHNEVEANLGQRAEKRLEAFQASH